MYPSKPGQDPSMGPMIQTQGMGGGPMPDFHRPGGIQGAMSPVAAAASMPSFAPHPMPHPQMPGHPMAPHPTQRPSEFGGLPQHGGVPPSTLEQLIQHLAAMHQQRYPMMGQQHIDPGYGVM